METFSQSELRLLALLALFGLFIPNGIFLYFALTAPGIVLSAIQNPIALVFMLEAFVLMGLFSWLISRAKAHSPNWVMFLLMSLLGSLAFSVPAALYLLDRARSGQGRKGCTE